VVNVDHLAGADGYPGGGTKAHLTGPTGLALALDGTLFIAGYGNHQIFALSPAGNLTAVAGTGTCGHSGDGQPATAATLCNPLDLALDETHGRKTLYVIDGTTLVRAIDFTASPPVISTFAGGGAAPAPGYGDGNAATYATLNSPGHLAVDPAGTFLYIVDHGIGRYRRVDLGNGLINTWLTVPANTSCTTNWVNGAMADCAIGFDASGTAFVAFATGNGVGNYSPTGGVYRTTAGGGTTLVAGGGTSGEGIQAVGAAVSTAVSKVIFDKAGNLYLIERSANRVRRIEAGVGRITTFLGTGAAGYAGDYLDLSQAQLSSPFSALFDANRDLVLADYGNNAVRRVWAIGASTFSWATLSASSGTPQTVVVDQVAPTLLSAQLLDPAAQPLAGYTVYWNVVDPGGALYVTSSVTNTQGVATAAARPGLLAGAAYHATASYSSLAVPLPSSPITFTLTGAAPAAGTMLSVVDVDHLAGGDGYPGPASRAHVNAPTGVAVAADGTMYIAGYNNHQVYALSPAGYLTAVVGTGTCGTSGDGAAATAATICNPLALALDETHTHKTLYILHGSVVRAVDLKANPPTITTFAGGGSAPGPGYGDGNPATVATLNSPQHIVLPPAGDSLYISDNGSNRIRRVDLLTSNIISNYLSPPANTSCLSNWSNGSAADCTVGFDAAGTAYVSWAAGNGGGGNYNPQGAIYKVVNGVVQTPALAGPGTSTGEGVLASTAAISTAVFQLYFDPGGSLYFLERGANRVRKLSDLTAAATVSTVIGTGVAGNGGEFLSPLGTALNAPYALAVTPDGKMLVTDTNNHTLRLIWPPYP
jgi:ribosomal protein S11